MRYFALADVARAVLFSSLLGFLMGCVYNSLSTLISCTYRLITICFDVLRSHSIKQCVKHYPPENTAVSNVKRSIYDLLFFVGCGIEYIILCYLTLDGVHRLYVLVPTVVAFFISKNTLGAIFEKLICFAYTAIYRGLFCVLYLLTYPLKVVCRLVYKLLTKPLGRLISFLKRRTDALQMRKKQRQIQDFFKSAPLI